MKSRNELLALLCLALFGALGVFYFRHWVVQKPFGIIIFIGEGLTPSRIVAARMYDGGAEARLAFDQLEHAALLRNYSADYAVPDAAAAGTALATGVRTNNGAVGVDASGKSVRNILELARKSGRAVGLVTDGALTHPTAASFYAHRADADDVNDIAAQLVSTDLLDIAFGGGERVLSRAESGEHDGPQRDLLDEAVKNDFAIARTKTELAAIAAWRRPRVLGLFGKDDLAFSDDVEGRVEQPGLPEMVEKAIGFLQYNPRGYLLVVDAHLMRVAAEANDGERSLRETVELAHAIDTARSFAGAKSLWIVAGDVGIGGLALNSGPFKRDAGVALLGLNSRGEPNMTWATGPKGLQHANDAPVQSDEDQDEPAAAYSENALNTADDMVLLGSGIGAQSIHGILDNIDVFTIIRNEL